MRLDISKKAQFVTECGINKTEMVPQCHLCFMSKRLLLFPLQLILQDHRHDDAHNADHQPAEEGVPEDGFTDNQPDPERLTDNARQPEQEGIDNQRE